jgi:5-formyltetrahydrofolate cyclo-ligase
LETLPLPGPDAELRRHAKRELGRRMKALRSALPKSAIADRSARLVARLGALPAFDRARAIALFWPMVEKNEVDVRGLDVAARALGKIVYYPFMDPTDDGFRTGFRRVDDVAELEERGRGFVEPRPAAPSAARGDVDLVIVPALALASDGHRLGYGVGFYDVTLPDVCPPAHAVAVAFSFQLLAELPNEAGDFRCQTIVTDETVIEIPSPVPGP